MKQPDARRLEPIPAALFVEQFAITLPDGRVWEGTLWKTPGRPRGRRIQVRTLATDSFGLFDTGDQFDWSNATNALDTWLAQFLPQPEPELAAAGEIRGG